jgi:hypothetical protein
MHSQPSNNNNLERLDRAPREKTNQSAIKRPSGNNDEDRILGSTLGEAEVYA